MTSFFSLLHGPLNFRGFVRLSSNLNGVYTWVFLQARNMQSLFSIQSDRYGKPVGRDVDLEQMIAWYMGKTSQNQLNPQEKRKRKKLFHALLGRCYLKVALGVVKADCIFVRFQVSLPWKKSFLWPMQFFAPYTTSTRNAISHFIVIDVNRLMSYSRQNKLVW